MTQPGNKAYQQYLTQEVMTSSPEKLVFMLYDKAISSLKDAILAIENGDIDKRCRSNTKAMQIIGHMWQTLDMEKGGEIAANLDRLYSFMLSHLPDVDFKNDPQPALDVIKLLEPLHASWKELAMNNPKSGEAQPAAPEIPTSPEASSATPSSEAPPAEEKELEPAVPGGGFSVSA